jgi:hypothetical protein
LPLSIKIAVAALALVALHHRDQEQGNCNLPVPSKSIDNDAPELLKVKLVIKLWDIQKIRREI